MLNISFIWRLVYVLISNPKKYIKEVFFPPNHWKKLSLPMWRPIFVNVYLKGKEQRVCACRLPRLPGVIRVKGTWHMHSFCSKFSVQGWREGNLPGSPMSFYIHDINGFTQNNEDCRSVCKGVSSFQSTLWICFSLLYIPS